MAPSSSMSAVAVTTVIMNKKSSRSKNSQHCFVPGTCEVWSGSHFILTVSTEKEMLVDARVRGGKLRPAQCHTADVSKLGWDPHLSRER